MRRTFIGLVVAVALTGAVMNAQDAGDTVKGQGVAAGQGADTGMTSGGATNSGTRARRDADRGFDMGWMGLIGLIGLVGLLPKNRRDHHHPATTMAH